MANVTIRGLEFALLAPLEAVYAGAFGIVRNCMEMDYTNESAVLAFLHGAADKIDEWFGAGAMKRIFGAEPVSTQALLSIVNATLEQLGGWYSDYLKGEYDE